MLRTVYEVTTVQLGVDSLPALVHFFVSVLFCKKMWNTFENDVRRTIEPKRKGGVEA